MCRCDFYSDRNGAGAVAFAPFRQCLHIGRREVFWGPAEMCGCRSKKRVIHAAFQTGYRKVPRAL